MNKFTFSNPLKIIGLSLAAVLLLGIGGCNKSDTSGPATSTNLDQATEAPSPTPTPTPTPSVTQTSGSTVDVQFSGGKFVPSSVKVSVGDTVRWTNAEGTTIRVASDPHPLHTGLPGLDDLKGSKKGDTYSFTFTKEGTWGYHDHFNPGAKGTVTVE